MAHTWLSGLGGKAGFDKVKGPGGGGGGVGGRLTALAQINSHVPQAT